MLNLKGFVTVHSLVNNSVNGTSLIGELSPLAKTYSTNQREYNHATLKDYTVTSFLEDNNSGNGVEIMAMSTAIDLVEAIRLYSVTNPGVIDQVSFNAFIAATFNARIANFTSGVFVNVGRFRTPEWIAWDALEVVPAQAGVAHIKLWLSDTAFIGQYDSFEIYYASAITGNNASLFSSLIAPVQTLADNNPPNVIIDKLDIVKRGIPESKTTLYRFDYVPINKNLSPIPFWFAVANYSMYGDSLDYVKTTITDDLLKNSAYTLLQWETIFPTLFKKSEFYIMPRWDLYAIPNMSVQTGIYSPIIEPTNAIDYATRHLPVGYTAQHISGNLSVFNSVYNELALEAIGDINNLNGHTSFKMVFPDYLSISTVSPDFSRMSINTQDFILLLEHALIAAETVTAVSNAPVNMRKTVRNGSLFISFSHNAILYLVATKYNNWK